MLKRLMRNSLSRATLGSSSAFPNAVIDGMDARNKIAKQQLSEEQFFAAMKGMVATAVYGAFNEKRLVT